MTLVNYTRLTDNLRDKLQGLYRVLRGGGGHDIHGLAGELRTAMAEVEQMVRNRDVQFDRIPDQRLGYLHLCMLIEISHRVLAQLPE